MIAKAGSRDCNGDCDGDCNGSTVGAAAAVEPEAREAEADASRSHSVKFSCVREAEGLGISHADRVLALLEV